MTSCVCVVASRTVLWLLFSFAALGCCILAFLTSTWLVAQSPPDSEAANVGSTVPPRSIVGTGLEVGLVRHCLITTVRTNENGGGGGDSCRFLSFSQYDTASWKASVILIGVGTGLLAIATALGVSVFWKQNIGHYNVVSVAGLIQGITMFVLVPGVAVYPIAWSSATFRRTCGEKASLYNSGNCDVGWGLYVVAGGALLALFACLLSPKAAKACNSRRVEEKIGNGYSCVFVP